MGITEATVGVSNPSRPRSRQEVRLIVDTGSILSWISEDRLRRLEIAPRREKEFRTIEGRLIRRQTGPATVHFDSTEADVEVVFARKGDAEVLGVTALESLGYRVNPVTRQLEQTGLLAL